MIGVDRKLSQLIAAGTSICGASAVIATNTVTEAHDEDVAYAVACVTVFGSIAMFVYPLLPGLLHLDAHAYGLWAGASIHEIAQVMAAAYQDGQQAGDAAAIAKLSRVAMLAPVVIVLGILAARNMTSGDRVGSSAKAPMPACGDGAGNGCRQAQGKRHSPLDFRVCCLSFRGNIQLEPHQNDELNRPRDTA